MNITSGHLLGGKRSEYLVSLVKQYVKPYSSILKLGCSVGSNLDQLWKAGYHNLSGVEINPEALPIVGYRQLNFEPFFSFHDLLKFERFMFGHEWKRCSARELKSTPVVVGSLDG